MEYIKIFITRLQAQCAKTVSFDHCNSGFQALDGSSIASSAFSVGGVAHNPQRDLFLFPSLGAPLISGGAAFVNLSAPN
jgi:hypothetical protein